MAIVNAYLLAQGGASGTTSPVTINLTTPPTVGNTLLLCAQFYNYNSGGTANTLTGTGGTAGSQNFSNIITVQLNPSTDGDVNLYMGNEFWILPDLTAAPTSVSFSYSGTTNTQDYTAYWVLELSMVPFSGYLDGSNSATWTNNFSGSATTSITTSNAQDLLLWAGVPTSSGSVYPGSPWNPISLTGGGNSGGQFQYQSVTTAGTYTGTLSGNGASVTGSAIQIGLIQSVTSSIPVGGSSSAVTRFVRLRRSL